MKAPSPTKEQLLLSRGTHWNEGLSPAELQRVMTDCYARVDGLSQKGRDAKGGVQIARMRLPVRAFCKAKFLQLDA